jgi:hypothetical protein
MRCYSEVVKAIVRMRKFAILVNNHLNEMNHSTTHCDHIGRAYLLGGSTAAGAVPKLSNLRDETLTLSGRFSLRIKSDLPEV